MNNFLRLLAIISCTLSLSVFSAGNVCKTGNIINRPGNSQPFYWPSTWRENHTAPHLENNQSCSWVVTIPKGYYAKVIISGRTNDTNSHFKTIDTAGNDIQTTHENKQPYYFPSPKFTIILSTEGAATFAFKIVWAQLPTVTSSSMGIGKDPQLVNISKNVFAAEYSAATGLSLLAFPADTKNIYSLRSTLVFEGTNADGTYISNLFLLYKSKKQWISSGSTIYVLNLEARNVEDKLLIQESGYTKDIAEYVEFSCPSGSTCSATLNAGHNKSAIVSVEDRYETLVGVFLNVNSFLTVYYGSPNDKDKRIEISGYTIESNLPMTFRSSVVQYVVTGEKAVLTFAVDDKN